MARNVYAWPPVDAVAHMWTVDQPLNISRSLITGKDYTSTSGRERLMAHISVPGIGTTTMNGGYCEALKRYLEGGKNLVRINSMPVNWYFDQVTINDVGLPVSVDWLDDGGGVTTNWLDDGGGTTVKWATSKILPGVIGTDGSLDTVTIGNLPANTLIARPGEYIRGLSRTDLSGDGSLAMVIRPAYSDGNGDCTIYLMEALTVAEHILFNASKSAVFRVDGDLPSAVQPVDGNWSYGWNFREVFSDEVGGFTEINPWT